MSSSSNKHNKTNNQKHTFDLTSARGALMQPDLKRNNAKKGQIVYRVINELIVRIVLLDLSEHTSSAPLLIGTHPLGVRGGLELPKSAFLC